ncbi:MAG: rubredoxin [Syntrophomonadaceae bacterium]
MMPVGPLMIEHRLIERVIAQLDLHMKSVSSPAAIDLNLLGLAIDFLRNYADWCHHGKEEEILFKALNSKPLSSQQQSILQELLHEHEVARAVVRELAAAREEALGGNQMAFQEVDNHLHTIIKLYPAHIEKEDRHFFIPIMKYFSAEEQAVMLQDFSSFDQQLIHKFFRNLVDKLELILGSTRSVKTAIGDNSQVYECTICGYLYDPKLGDPDHNVPRDTIFSHLPADWVCPVCGAGKDLFKSIVES